VRRTDREKYGRREGVIKIELTSNSLSLFYVILIDKSLATACDLGLQMIFLHISTA
jgi:hypothetical protein